MFLKEAALNPDNYSDKRQLCASPLVLEMEVSHTVNITEAQLVQSLVKCDKTVHTESTTAQTISKDTDVPSHGTALYPETA